MFKVAVNWKQRVFHSDSWRSRKVQQHDAAPSTWMENADTWRCEIVQIYYCKFIVPLMDYNQLATLHLEISVYVLYHAWFHRFHCWTFYHKPDSATNKQTNNNSIWMTTIPADPENPLMNCTLMSCSDVYSLCNWTGHGMLMTMTEAPLLWQAWSCIWAGSSMHGA